MECAPVVAPAIARTADSIAFKNKYGTNATKSNAFGKCASTKAKTQNS
jgi:hypothetical protein